MTEQIFWQFSEEIAISAAAIAVTAALFVVHAIRKMSGKRSAAQNPQVVALRCLTEENDLIAQHRQELLAALRTSTQRDRLRSVDLRISAYWFSADGMQLLLDAMLDAIRDAQESGADAGQIRQSVINPYIIPLRMRLAGLQRALEEAISDCFPIPDDADLRFFLELTDLRPTDSADMIRKKSSENKRLISNRLQTHGYTLHYDKLLDDLVSVFDSAAVHAFDDGNTPDAHACDEALTQITQDVARLRTIHTRP